MIRRLTIIFGCMLLAVAAAQAATFHVRHDHRIGSCVGDLVFGERTVEYTTSKTAHERTWKYEDIQQLELASRRISILTYEGSRLELGDRSFHFELLDGEVTDTFRREVEPRLTRPVVSSVIPVQEHARYIIPVRRRRVLGGGSQGVLEMGERYIVYRAADGKHSQIWRYDELQSVGTTGPFQLRINDDAFDLKRRLRNEEYDYLWNKVNR